MGKAWNIRAAIAVIGFLIINGVAAAYLFLGHIDFKEWFASTSGLNGIAIGWLFRDLSVKESQ